MATKEQTLTELEKFFPVVWDAFETAMSSVQGFFDKNKKEDIYLASHLVRYYVKKNIGDNQWKLSNFHIEDLPNTGLSFYYNSFHIRIWKYAGSELPLPGFSKSKDAFLRQQRSGRQINIMDMLGLFNQEDEDKYENLALLWVADKNLNLKGLILSHPEKDYSGASEIRADWSICLKHPIETLSAPKIEVIEESLDLPIEFEEEFEERDELSSGKEG